MRFSIVMGVEFHTTNEKSSQCNVVEWIAIDSDEI